MFLYEECLVREKNSVKFLWLWNVGTLGNLLLLYTRGAHRRSTLAWCEFDCSSFDNSRLWIVNTVGLGWTKHYHARQDCMSSKLLRLLILMSSECCCFDDIIAGQAVIFVSRLATSVPHHVSPHILVPRAPSSSIFFDHDKTSLDIHASLVQRD